MVSIASAQSFGPELYGGLRWRMIGPFRGGRTVAASGLPGQPNVFYIAANNGGVWKSTDAGRVWKPIFDDQDTGSIGALAVAPSGSRPGSSTTQASPAVTSLAFSPGFSSDQSAFAGTAAGVLISTVAAVTETQLEHRFVDS